jgi:alcohol dehydrogenase
MNPSAHSADIPWKSSDAGRLAPFEWRGAVHVVFGENRVEELGERASQLGVRRPLLVTDPGVEAAGHVERAIRSLVDAGFEPLVFDGVAENPTTRHVQAGLELAKTADVDGFIGLGGGSAMDAAKGVNFLLTNGGEMADYWGAGKAAKPLLPMIAAPTTAGTGSEAQSFALIADDHTHRKMACGDRTATPRVALLDPALTLTQPPRVTAVCGLDAVAHALESWASRTRNPVSCMFAAEAWRRLRRGFPQVLRDPADLAARGDVLLGAHLAGHAVESSMLGAAHAAANPLTMRFDVTHGLAVALMLPHVIRFNAARADFLYAELFLHDGDDANPLEGAGEVLARQVCELFEKTGLPGNLAECGVVEAAIPGMAHEAVEQWTARYNPVPVTLADFEALYRRAYNGR